MNKLGTLISTYNSFISDIKNLIDDITEIMENNNQIKFHYEVWSPRDRPAWSVKDNYTKIFTNTNEVFYIGIDLAKEEPYLLLSHILVTLSDCIVAEFTEYDTFVHIENNDIKKRELYPGIYEFTQNWGKCTYCKIDIMDIDSRELVYTEIKSIIQYLFDSSSELVVKNIIPINFV